MRPVTVTTSNATGGAVNSSPIPMDYNASVTFNAGFTCVVTGTVSYSVQTSNDNSAWFESADASSAAANSQGSFQFPVKYVRLHQASGSGSVTMTLIQTGPSR